MFCDLLAQHLAAATTLVVQIRPSIRRWAQNRSAFHMRSLCPGTESRIARSWAGWTTALVFVI